MTPKTKDTFLLSTACQTHRKTKSRLCHMNYLQNTEEETLTQYDEVGA